MRQGIISDLVPRGDLQNAIAINTTQFQTNQLVGPALAGVVVARFGAGWVFLINGLSFLAVIVSLLRLRLPPWRPPRKTPSWRSASEGLTFVFRHEVLGLLVLIAAVPPLLARPAQQALLPNFAAAVLNVGAPGLGWLMGATGAGAVLGALLVASLGEYRYRSLLQLGALAAYGVTLALFAASRRLEFSLALLFVASAASMIASSLNQTFLQSLAPDAMCGRVLGVLTLTTFVLMPLGGLLAGAAAQRWGVPIVVGIAGVLTALFALSILLTRPPERNLP